jgi:hypothetical protein
VPGLSPGGHLPRDLNQEALPTGSEKTGSPLATRLSKSADISPRMTSASSNRSCPIRYHRDCQRRSAEYAGMCGATRQRVAPPCHSARPGVRCARELIDLDANFSLCLPELAKTLGKCARRRGLSEKLDGDPSDAHTSEVEGVPLAILVATNRSARPVPTRARRRRDTEIARSPCLRGGNALPSHLRAATRR